MSQDPYLALMSYRATSMPWCNLSPAQLCMGRRIRTPIPQVNKLLIPDWTYLPMFREKNKQYKDSQKQNFDRRQRVRELSPISDNTSVWITSERQPMEGRVVSAADSPRSYVIDTPSGQVHRNRSHLNVVPEQSMPEQPMPDNVEMETGSQPRVIMTRSQTGTEIRPPERLT